MKNYVSFLSFRAWFRSPTGLSPAKTPVMTKKQNASADEQNALAKLSSEITSDVMENADALLKIWQDFNTRIMNEQIKENEYIKTIKDVKINKLHTKILVEQWGLDRIEAITLLKKNNDNLEKVCLDLITK